MPFISKASCLSILMLMFSASPALAHSLWLETVEAHPRAGQALEVNVGFNEGFEVTDILEQSVPMISAPYLLRKDGEIKFKPRGGPNYAYLSEKPVPAGSCLLFAEYKPFIMGHGDSRKNKYIMTAKHIVNIGGGHDDLVAQPRHQSRLEIVPLANPSTLKAGGSLPVQVLFEGRPLSRAELFGDFRGFNPAGSWGLAKAFYCKTDQNGQVDFLPTKGGLWILKVRHAVPNEDQSEAAETVYLSNVTFQVGD
ncbi:MAG: DUF4198 domain-containing protein [Candidatus Adiutrix sp.]|nr:DUF4198 domain-containing protein [Candidatus Adiutrix sp.]